MGQLVVTKHNFVEKIVVDYLLCIILCKNSLCRSIVEDKSFQDFQAECIHRCPINIVENVCGVLTLSGWVATIVATGCVLTERSYSLIIRNSCESIIIYLLK